MYIYIFFFMYNVYNYLICYIWIIYVICILLQYVYMCVHMYMNVVYWILRKTCQTENVTRSIVLYLNICVHLILLEVYVKCSEY